MIKKFGRALVAGEVGDFDGAPAEVAVAEPDSVWPLTNALPTLIHTATAIWKMLKGGLINFIVWSSCVKFNKRANLVLTAHRPTCSDDTMFAEESGPSGDECNDDASQSTFLGNLRKAATIPLNRGPSAVRNAEELPGIPP
jgi:hypothetical protein